MPQVDRMTLGSDLEDGFVIDSFGTLWAAGYAEGAVWVEYSTDQGATIATWPDGATTRQRVCPADEGTWPAVEGLTTGELVVVVPQGGALVVYLSRDRGMTWVVTGTL